MKEILSSVTSYLLRRQASKLQVVRNRGFTLVELLVVIAIIGILAATIGINYAATKKTARDAKRKADMENIAAAIELYYSQFKCYPENIQSVSSSGYITTIPKDPKANTDYAYIADTASCPKWFAIYGQLENTSESSTLDIQNFPEEDNISSGSGVFIIDKEAYYRVVGR